MLSKEEVILTPIYKNTSYQYHECSNCKKEIYLKKSILIPFEFEEKIKYCPFCGSKIIRYAEPKYVEAPDWSWLDKFTKLLSEIDRKLEYEILCKMSNEERKELINKANFGIEYFGSSIGWCDNTNICRIIKDVAYRKLHYSQKNKLIKEFERSKSNAK